MFDFGGNKERSTKSQRNTEGDQTFTFLLSSNEENTFFQALSVSVLGSERTFRKHHLIAQRNIFIKLT